MPKAYLTSDHRTLSRWRRPSRIARKRLLDVERGKSHTECPVGTMTVRGRIGNPNVNKAYLVEKDSILNSQSLPIASRKMSWAESIGPVLRPVACSVINSNDFSGDTVAN